MTSSPVALEPLLPRSDERTPTSPRLEGPGWSPPPSPFAFVSFAAKDQKSRRRAVFLLLLLAVAVLTGVLFKLDDGVLETLIPRTRSDIVSPAAHLALKAGQPPGEHFRGRWASIALSFPFPAADAGVNAALPSPDSLLSDRRYITSFSLAGFNNQVRLDLSPCRRCASQPQADSGTPIDAFADHRRYEPPAPRLRPSAAAIPAAARRHPSAGHATLQPPRRKGRDGRPVPSRQRL